MGWDFEIPCTKDMSTAGKTRTCSQLIGRDFRGSRQHGWPQISARDFKGAAVRFVL